VKILHDAKLARTVEHFQLVFTATIANIVQYETVVYFRS